MKKEISGKITIIIILIVLSTGCSNVENKGVVAENNENDTVQVPDGIEDNNGNVTEAEQVNTITFDEWIMGMYGLEAGEFRTFREWREERGGIKAGDVFTFGEWRDEPIVWRALDIKDEKVLVISNEILALRQYNNAPEDLSLGRGDYKYSTWAECSLRTWLNNDFYQTAFSEEERQEISMTLVKTPEINRVIETPVLHNSAEIVEETPIVMQGSADTEDMVFCLSIEEAEAYFCWDVIRIANMTVTEQDYDYAVQAVEAIGGNTEDWWYIFGGYERNEKTPKMWWLRSGTYVNPYGGIWLGSITMDGDIPAGWPCGVRPAMWLQI